MTPELAARLAALPRLGSSSAAATSLPCKLCAGPAEFFDVTDFWKGSAFFRFGASGIAVQHYRCRTCGFMWAPLFDDWTKEDFARHIYNDEYHLVDGEYAGARPRRTAEHMAKWLAGHESARILDYGSGSGLFAQHMQHAGFERVSSFDPFSEPTRPAGQFDIITCFEVIEHSPVPDQTMRDLAEFLADDGCIILGESLQPPEIGTVRCGWWYCMPRNGHISFYTDRSLAALAAQVGLLFHPGAGLHGFSRPTPGKFANLARCIGLPLLPITLGAPSAAEDSPAIKNVWHGVERFAGIPTRWTRSPEVSWRGAVPSGGPMAVRIRIPFAGQVRPNFAAESRVLVDGIAAKAVVQDGAIFAEQVVAGGTEVTITLRTPPVMVPARVADSSVRRQLGLAVPCMEGQ
jgi:SAM-dependent methyltransferase